MIRIAAENVHVGSAPSDNGPSLFHDGRGAFVFTSSGIAGIFSGTFDLSLPGVNASATPVLEINRTGTAIDQTVVLPTGSVRIKFATTANVFKVSVRSLLIKIGDPDNPVLTLSGDFTTSTITTGPLTGASVYGARNVEIFLGSGPYRNADGSLNPDAVGVVVTGATVGVVSMPNGGGFALYAYGVAGLVGIPGITVTGSLKVEINHLGQAVNVNIDLPALPGEAILAPIPVVYSTPLFVERFAVGVDEHGNPTPNGLTIDLGGVFSLSGNVTFSKAADGTVDVNIPSASVSIKAPLNGTVQDIFTLKGAASFSFGGTQGFQMRNFRVNGIDLFGATVLSPASGRR